MKYLALTAALYLAICSVIWQIRNPLANGATVYTHLPSVLTFQKLDKFQTR